MSIQDDILDKVREKFQIDAFNPMQEEAFKVISNFEDTILLSATGSGKTLAFLIPVLSALDTESLHTQCLIIAPTRELALQITHVAANMALGLNIETCYGGHPVRTEKKALANGPQVVIGTPGRLQDHLERGNLNPRYISTVILDEFDKTLEMGFHKQMAAIIRFLKLPAQFILTSATKALEIPYFLKLRDPHTLNFLNEGQLEGLSIHLVRSPDKDKLETLFHLVNDIGNQSTFIFCNYRETVERVSSFLQVKNIPNDSLHGGMDQLQRENVLSKFRNGSTRILVTTDLAGRGLDIPEVENIIHYHMPITGEVYTHRNGRTARMDKTGNAYLLIHEQEDIPEFVGEIPREYYPTKMIKTISPPEWITVQINKGKRDKINKVDVVGFLTKVGNLTKEELGLVEVKDSFSLAAVKAGQWEQVYSRCRDQKMKGKKVLISKL